LYKVKKITENGTYTIFYDSAQVYGFRNDEFFTLKLYALHGSRLRI